MGDALGYQAEDHDVEALLQHLCGDLLAEPDDLIAYGQLTSEQVRFEELVSRIRQERGRRLAEMRSHLSLTWQQLADAANLGSYQQAQQIVGYAEPKTAPGP